MAMKQSKCIIAKLEVLRNGQKQEKSRFKIERVNTSEVDLNQLKELNNSLSELEIAENSMDQKMIRIRDTLKKVQTEIKGSWRSMIQEDLLLERIESLENKLKMQKDDKKDISVIKDKVLAMETIIGKLIKEQKLAFQLMIYFSIILSFAIFMIFSQFGLFVSKSTYLTAW